MSPWLSIVVPTAGQRRKGLLRTLESVMQQPGIEGVEVVVVADTHGLANRAGLDSLRHDVEAFANCAWHEHDGGLHCYGHPQRDYGTRQARGQWVAFSQDDNILAQGAIASIAAAALQQAHERPMFFRAQMYWGEVVWREPYLWQGNIDADCLVLPCELAETVSWGLRYEGDFDMAVSVMQRAQGDVAWRTETIAIARPEQVWW